MALMFGPSMNHLYTDVDVKKDEGTEAGWFVLKLPP